MLANEAMKLLRAAIVLLLAGCVSSGPRHERFVLRSDFVVNLHQRLLGDASERMPRTFDELEPGDRAIWREAVEAYRKGDRNELVEFRVALAGGPVPVDARWRAVVDRAAPVYRKVWWSGDDARNREFITMLRPLVDEHGEALIREHARVYGLPVPFRATIDIAAYAGQFGANTIISDEGLPFVTISPRDEVYRGRAALELVMHEVSHSLAFHDRGVIGGTIDEHARTLGIKSPFNLWHAILFFNTGEITRRYFAARGIDYEPYAFKTGVYNRMDARYLPVVRAWWPQVVDRKLSVTEGVRRIVEEVAKR
jgi:hypothetical protein